MAKDSRVEDLPRSGRPRALNKPNRRKLASRVEGKRYRSVRKTSKYFATQGVSASKSAIHRELRRQKLQPYHRPKVPKLTRAQRQKRVAFARAMKNHNWDKTLMSDETEMRLYSAKGANTKNDVVWAHSRSEVPPRQVVAHPPTVRLWAGVAKTGRTNLHFYKGNLTAKEYVKILKKAKPEMLRIFGRSRWTYGHDGAAAHKAAKTNQWLEANVPAFIRSGPNGDWPANSPDLNWIEGIWGVLADRVNQPRAPRTTTGLERKLRKVWKNLEPELFQNAVRGMPDRLKQVIATNGKPLRK